jgi:hypothetical protein
LDRDLIFDIKQEIAKLKGIKNVELQFHPNDYASLRIQLLNYAPIPSEIIQKFPENLWGFVIDASHFRKHWGRGRWADFDRVGNVLFSWHMGHWRRILGGFNPLFDPENDWWDNEIPDKIISFGTEGFPEERIIDAWEPVEA